MSKNIIPLTVERLHELLHYDPETGAFVWRVQRGPRIAAGTVAGSFNRKRYRGIKVDDVLYVAHRLAWLYIYGVWPEKQIDHINGVRHDNRIHNLREVTPRENSQNQRRAHRDSRSGVLGVHKTRYGWQARIETAGVQRVLGTFATPDVAHAAYLQAKRALHPGGLL